MLDLVRQDQRAMRKPAGAGGWQTLPLPRKGLLLGGGRGGEEEGPACC